MNYDQDWKKILHTARLHYVSRLSALSENAAYDPQVLVLLQIIKELTKIIERTQNGPG